MDLAMGWFDVDSTAAVYLSRSLESMFSGSTLMTLNIPWVRVPVLSNTTMSALDIASMWVLPLIRIPRLEALPMPQKYDRGMESTNAQGQDTTRNTIPLYAQSTQSSGKRSEGMMAISAAQMTTAGV